VIGFVASSPYFRGDWETAPNLEKKLMMPSFANLSLPNGATYENDIIALHFGEKIHKFSLIYFGGSVADLLYKFNFRA